MKVISKKDFLKVWRVTQRQAEVVQRARETRATNAFLKTIDAALCKHMLSSATHYLEFGPIDNLVDICRVHKVLKDAGYSPSGNRAKLTLFWPEELEVNKSAFFKLP